MMPSTVRIFVCTEPVDLRRSFDGLAAAAKQILGHDPQSGALFCFVNKRHNRLKVLWWERNGYCLLYKRLHQAVFVVPSSTANGSVAVNIDARQLAKLVEGVVRPRAHKGLDRTSASTKKEVDDGRGATGGTRAQTR